MNHSNGLANAQDSLNSTNRFKGKILKRIDEAETLISEAKCNT